MRSGRCQGARYAAPVLAIPFFLLFLGLWAAAVVFWVVKIVEVCRLPEHQYRAANTEKTTWVLVVVLVGLIGAFVWQFAKRDDVVRAAGRLPGAPPGWYPDPYTGAPRFWDGVRWGPAAPTPPVAGSTLPPPR